MFATQSSTAPGALPDRPEPRKPRTADTFSFAHGMTEAQLTAAWATFNDALYLALAGNISLLAREIGMTPQAVHRWGDRKFIPAHRVPDVVGALKGMVEAAELRPDVYRTATPTPDAQSR